MGYIGMFLSVSVLSTNSDNQNVNEPSDLGCMNSKRC